ncbi:hypothetical protein FVE85_3975 [Porphyridium purpureum]|uniref:Uncharacterized protein n=1 Tax=Porphyridium purpureum TaxID=35688 RepID=A0A5J4YSU2_PORPP|nr:hypothetical protein FVE85_3975 [Porphyridium purpureum]|eukprot:POR7287..scf229_5
MIRRMKLRVLICLIWVSACLAAWGRALKVRNALSASSVLVTVSWKDEQTVQRDTAQATTLEPCASVSFERLGVLDSKGRKMLRRLELGEVCVLGMQGTVSKRLCLEPEEWSWSYAVLPVGGNDSTLFKIRRPSPTDLQEDSSCTRNGE